MDKAYAYKNKRSVLMRSSSGGAFWGIAEAFFEGGVFATEQNLILTLKSCMEKQKI